MRLLRLSALGAALGAAALAGCASAGEAPPLGPAPVYVRSWGQWTPEDRHRDVVECSEAARTSLEAEPDLARRALPTLRPALRRRTGECLRERGWRPG